MEGAALGACFDVLFTSVVEATKKVAGFTPHLNRLQSILSCIKPIIDDVETLNLILDRPRHETEAFTARLIEAERLVVRCSKVSKWNVFMRLYYSSKLSNLEASLLTFFQINVAVLHLCETKRVSVVVRDLQEKVNQMAKMLNKLS
ncbi:hypothetical protein C2S51_006416 [Perilla frutescens var. frutescens]|nr:hypothetical protein C2S51_006416 [Perilla frutescens var. frutescens]